MRGYSKESLLERSYRDVTPLRFNLLVRLHPETPKSSTIVIPDVAKGIKDSTRGWHGTIAAMGELVKDSQAAEGLLDIGTHIIFDESVSIDDPQRCFVDGEDRYVMFDLDTVMGAFSDNFQFPMLLADRVLIQRPEKKEKALKSGLLIPIVAAREPIGGRVVAVGAGAFRGDGKRLPMSVGPGERVLFGRYSGTEIMINDREYVVLKQDKILAVVKGDADVESN